MKILTEAEVAAACTAPGQTLPASTEADVAALKASHEELRGRLLAACREYAKTVLDVIVDTEDTQHGRRLRSVMVTDQLSCARFKVGDAVDGEALDALMAAFGAAPYAGDSATRVPMMPFDAVVEGTVTVWSDTYEEDVTVPTAVVLAGSGRTLRLAAGDPVTVDTLNQLVGILPQRDKEDS